jgi:hypothetical protein
VPVDRKKSVDPIRRNHLRYVCRSGLTGIPRRRQTYRQRETYKQATELEDLAAADAMR